MKLSLQIIAILVVLVALGIWLATGANIWTKTSVAVAKKDPVTDIEYQEFQKQFRPGVEFLGAALLGAGLLTGASFFFRTKPRLRENN